MMVQISPEEVMARKRQEIEFGGMTDYDRQHVGAAIRLEIPFTDEFKMRKIADWLRGYAEFIDQTSRHTNLPLRTRLSLMKLEARGLNSRIKDLHGRENFNSNGTTRKVSS
jgi:hypothetical protein